MSKLEMNISGSEVGTRGHGPNKSGDEFNAELAAEMVKRTAKLNDSTIDLALRLREAREFMAWSASHMRTLWLEWVDESKETSKEITIFRMAFDREAKAIMGTGKDLIAFFNSPEYLQAHNTLKESVALLDRFTQLRNDGQLDALADFILKVSK